MRKQRRQQFLKIAFLLVWSRLFFLVHVSYAFFVPSRLLHHVQVAVNAPSCAAKSSIPFVSFKLRSSDWEDSNNDSDSDEAQNVRLVIPRPKEAPFLTTMEQKRRETERSLLTQLFHGDDAIPEFKKLWFSERGPQTEKIMHQAELGIGLPAKWEETKEALETLIRQDPTYIEPYVRLSKLYCLEGRLEESKVLCQDVLKQKPWHFVALETIMAVHTAQQNVNQMQHWAGKRLPRPFMKEERKQWVKRALINAKHQLEQSRQGRHSDFNVSKGDDKVDDAWQ